MFTSPHPEIDVKNFVLEMSIFIPPCKQNQEKKFQ